MRLLRAIAARDEAKAARLLEASPALARRALEAGASRANPAGYYFRTVGHYAYAGDTALHLAAAAYARAIVAQLLALGADARGRNRRGAEPLHYAADGIPGSAHWDPAAQAAVITLLIEAGADPNALDKSGVGPLHRAVRTRCAGAVQALLAGGADPSHPNRRGSTPFLLAVGNTGRGGSGSPTSRREQEEIIALLSSHGARDTTRLRNRIGA